MQQADASDVSESIPVITSPAAPLQPEFIIVSRTRQQTEFQALDSKDAPDLSESIPVITSHAAPPQP
eukprot:9284247-Pyramimonas_sp.AAC.1